MASRVAVKSGMAARVKLRCWGDFTVSSLDTGAELKPRGRKARALLAYLAMHPGRSVSRERLMGLLWGERADEQARASLRQTLFELRPFAQAERPVLEVGRESVMLIPEAVETDIDRLRKLCDAGDYDALMAALPDADDILFENLDGIDPSFDDWLRVERTRQRDALIALIADASAGALADGRTRAARALHARLLELGPDEIHPAPGPSEAVAPVSLAVGPEPAARIGRRALLGASSLLLASAAIGGAVWWRSGGAASAAAPSREVRGLYDQARAIIYERKGEEYKIATNLLRRALVLEPDYPPALTSLASVTAMSDNSPEGLAEAERLVRRAIKLAPDLAEAHGTLGMILGFKSSEARTAIRRAAAIDSRDPQIQFWLSHVRAHDGDYVGRLKALRRAVATDPLWARSSGTAALAAWELGFRDEADGYAARLRKLDLRLSFNCSYAIDFARGDYSDVVRDTLAARERLAQVDAADWKLGMGLLVLGHDRPARLLLRLPPPLWRVASDAGPAPGEIEAILIDAERNERADAFVLTALRQVLRDGRPEEIVAAYEQGAGTLKNISSGDAPNATVVTIGLQAALALRAVGREREAALLLDRADAAIRRSHGFGAVPNWMHAAAASVWASQGRSDDALTALERGVDRGWHYLPMTPLPDMGDIPSFAGLRGDARFEQLRLRLKTHLQQERRELGPVPV